MGWTLKRKIEVGLVLSLIALAITVLILTHGQSLKFPSLSSSKYEISIRNVTGSPVGYTLRPQDFEGRPAEKVLKVGAVERFRSRREVDITYERMGREMTYQLLPGRHYSFRYDSHNLLQIYLGSHGRDDAVDLAPYIATPMNVVERMLEMAEVHAEDVLYDLGCGDGRIVIAAAEKYGARGVGIDIDPARIQESRAWAEKAGVEKLVEFRVQDATKTDISPATVVTLYLLPESNELLRPLLEEQLKPGARVISHNYRIPGWEDREIEATTLTDSTGLEHSIFLYHR